MKYGHIDPRFLIPFIQLPISFPTSLEHDFMVLKMNVLSPIRAVHMCMRQGHLLEYWVPTSSHPPRRMIPPCGQLPTANTLSRG